MRVRAIIRFEGKRFAVEYDPASISGVRALTLESNLEPNNPEGTKQFMMVPLDHLNELATMLQEMQVAKLLADAERIYGDDSDVEDDEDYERRSAPCGNEVLP